MRFFPINNGPPIDVVVREDRFDILTPLKPSNRQIVLARLLLKMGVNEDVEPGHYHFNTKRQGLFKFEATLNRVE